MKLTVVKKHFFCLVKENSDEKIIINRQDHGIEILIGCQLTEFSNEKVGIMGYLIKIYRQKGNLSFDTKNTNPDEKTPEFRFEFLYDPDKEIYKRKRTWVNQSLPKMIISSEDVRENVVQNKVVTTISKENYGKEISEAIKLASTLSLEDLLNAISNSEKHYGSNVTTYRIRKGKIKKITPLPTLLQSIAFSVPQDDDLQAQNDFRSIEKARIAKLKKDYHNSLSDQPIPAEVIHLLLVSAMLLSTIVILTAVDYWLFDKSLNKAQNSIDLLWVNNNIFQLVGDSWYQSLSLNLLKENVIVNYEDSNSTLQYESNLRTRLGNNIGLIENLIDEFQSDLETFGDIFNSNLGSRDLSVMNYNSEGEANLTMSTCLEYYYMVNSALLNIKEAPLEALSTLDMNILFVRNNYLNAHADKIRKLYQPIYLSLADYIDKQVTTIEIMFIIASFALFLCSLAFIPFILKAKITKQELLSNFLRIPKQSVYKLTQKCEHYLTNFQQDIAQGEDQQSTDKHSAVENENEQQQQELSDEFEYVLLPKEFLPSCIEKLSLIGICFLVTVFLDTYFIFSYAFLNYISSVMQSRLDSINAICIIHGNTQLLFNCFREMTINSTSQVLYQNNSNLISEQLIIWQRIYSENIIKANLITDSWLLGSHIDFFKSWLYGSICNNYQQYFVFDSQQECQNFLNNKTTKGTYTLLMDFIFTMRNFLSNSSDVDFMNILNSESWIDQRKLVESILSTQFQIYNTYYQGLISDHVEYAMKIKVILMICYIVLVVVVMLCFLLPYIVKIRSDLCNTEGMLILIPNNVIAGNKQLKEIFVKKNAINAYQDD